MGYPRPLFEVADVIRLHGDTFLASHSVSWHQRQVLFRMQACRTAQLGGHIDVCPTCAGTQRISYNSCRDRHCPKCQGREREKWVERSLARILPVPHFHVVFTLPDTLRPLFLAQPRRLYTLLFQSASRALLELTADPRHLGALPGFIAILHTWAQNLSHHPHLHCIVTAGGLAPDDSRWIETRPTFLLPVNALAKRFRCLFRHALIRLLASHHLGLWDSPSLASFHQALRQKRWVVYAKRPFRGPEPLFRYLGRYTHRIGFSNHRLRSVTPESVCFTVRTPDPDTGQRRVLLPGPEFIRRLLLHVLPKGFVRIRHYGLYSSTHRASHLAQARPLLAPTLPPDSENTSSAPPPRPLCPHCGAELTRLGLPRPFLLSRPSSTRAPPHAA